MKLALPFSRAKRYLTGIDWMIQALDYSSRGHLGCGTAFQIRMDLKGEIKPAEMEKCLSDYYRHFPFLAGKFSRDLNLAPYWKPEKQKSMLPFAVESSAVSGSEAAARYLETALNQPAKQTLPLRVVCALMTGQTILGFIFDHRFFDARGAEQFLSGFQDYFSKNNVPEVKPLTAPAYLDCWEKQFAAGKKVNRSQIAQKKEQKLRSVLCFDAARVCRNTKNLFKIKTFDENETRSIAQRAGPFMLLPYLLAESAQAVQALFSQRGAVAGQISISVTKDMRSTKMQAPEIFFNHLSFLFFQTQTEAADKRGQIFEIFKAQLYDQIKNKMPEALADASMLMRILPLKVLAWGLGKSARAPLASFASAYLGESAYAHTDFMGVDIENIIHMPRIPPSPGVGIFFSQYKKKLNLTVSYLDCLVSETEVHLLMEGISQI